MPESEIELSPCNAETALPSTKTASRPFKLRPYQKSAVSAVVSRYRDDGQRRMLLYLPTGAGKTVIATFIIKALRGISSFGRVLFVAHRREILDQTARTLRFHLPKLKVEIEQGERSSSGDADITVASVQSLVRRKERYNPKGFDLIVCDECHRALAASWEDVIGYFWAHVGIKTLLLGMTATPRRTDGRSALDVFGQTAFEVSRTDLEDLGFLVPMQYFTVRSDLQLSRVKLSGGDFQVGALSAVMDTPQQRAMAVKAWLEQGASKRTIAFCASVEHSQHLSEDFQAAGIAAAMVDGKTKDRDQLLARFRSGEIRILANYGVLTEGFDDPEVACILMARPTTSALVYTQCVGRGLRTAPGKNVCTVIDIVDRSTHELQYGALQMANLPPKWKCRGGDPFRQSQSLRAIKVTTPEAFLRIRDASCLEEVQSILMSLPPDVVVAGLDGEPMLRYEPVDGECSEQTAENEVKRLLRQARVRGAKVTVKGDCIGIAFRASETDNERYGYLKWHLGRVTGRTVIYESPKGKHRFSSPRTLLRSMLPEGCRISEIDANASGESIVASIEGLTPEAIAEIESDFRDECGMSLDLKGQMALF